MAFSAITIKGGGGGDGRSIRNTITQVGHTFQPGIVVRRDSVTGVWVAASSNTFSYSNTVGIIESVTSNTFVVVYQGEIDFGGGTISIDDSATGLTNGYVYYLSSSSSLTGYISAKTPTDTSVVYHPLFVATSASKGVVVNALPRVGNSGGQSLFTPVGTIVPYAGSADAVPTNWLLCAGDLVSKNTYPTLYTRIGDAYRIVGLEGTISTGISADDTMVINFSGSLTGAPASGIGSTNIHSIVTGEYFKLMWDTATGKDVVVAVTTSINNASKTATFRYINDHPATSHAHTSSRFSTLSGGGVTPITIQPLANNGEGVGATSANFFLPDLRARTVYGVGSGTGLTSAGMGRGEFGGAQTHILTEAEMPSHSHDNKVSSTTTSVGEFYLNPAASNPTQASAWFGNKAASEITGNDESFGIQNPYVATNWIIRSVNATGTLIDECLPGAQGSTGSQGNTGSIGVTGPIGLQGTSGVRGSQGPQGPQGAQGPQGSDGAAGQDCVCASLVGSTKETTIFIASTSLYNGTREPLSSVLSSTVALSTNVTTPTDFAYFKSVLLNTATPFSTFFNDVQHFNNLNPVDAAYFGALSNAFISTRTQPSEYITRNLDTTVNLNFQEQNNENNSWNPVNFIFAPGVYNVEYPFSSFGTRKITFSGGVGSVFDVPLQHIHVGVGYSATGATESSYFYLNCLTGLTGLSSPIVATGNYSTFKPNNLRIPVPLGFTSGNDLVGGSILGASGATFSFLTSILGIYEVVSNGWSGNSGYTVKVPHIPVGATTSAPIGIPFGATFASSVCGITSATIMTTVFNVTGPNGFFVGDSNTNVFIGGGSKEVAQYPIVIRYTAQSATASEEPLKNVKNACGIQTMGNLYIGAGVGILSFPTGVHAAMGAKVISDGAYFMGNYNAIGGDNASIAIKNSSVLNRNQFGLSLNNSDGDVRGASVFARNGLAIASQSSSLLMRDPTKASAAIIRQSPAVVAFNSASVVLDNIVADHPNYWMACGTAGGQTASTTMILTPSNTYSVYGMNSTISVTDPPLSSARGNVVQIPWFGFDNTNVAVRTTSTAAVANVLSAFSKVSNGSNNVYVKNSILAPATIPYYAAP